MIPEPVLTDSIKESSKESNKEPAEDMRRRSSTESHGRTDGLTKKTKTSDVSNGLVSRNEPKP